MEKIKMSKIIALAALIFSIAISIVYGQRDQHTCRDEEGNPVDWWILYKFPYQLNLPEIQPRGTRYFYRTSATGGDNHLSSFSINDPNSILNRTVSTLVSDLNFNLEYYTYNDELVPPEESEPSQSTSFAHAKGIVVFEPQNNVTGGFWLTHTVPRLFAIPGHPELSQYPSNGFQNGQVAICISLQGRDDPNLANMRERLCQIRVHRHAQNINDPCTGGNPPSQFQSFFLKPRNGFYFASNQQNNPVNVDIYSLLDRHFPSLLETGLIVQSWDRTGGAYPPVDWIRNNAETLSEVRINDTTTLSLTWPTTVDHGIVATDGNGFYCFGDLNRVPTMRLRGGGLICFHLHGFGQNPFVVLMPEDE